MVRPRAVVVATVLAAASLGGWWSGRSVDPGTFRAVVVDVPDGDTIVVRVGEADDAREETVRLLNVDTPETHHPTRPVGCFGPEAAAFTRRRLLGRAVSLELDNDDRDVYGRLLAHVRIDGRVFGDVLLERGYARLLVIPPNTARARRMLFVELAARRAGAGLWSACGEE